jgi:hypothetical protein
MKIRRIANSQNRILQDPFSWANQKSASRIRDDRAEMLENVRKSCAEELCQCKPVETISSASAEAVPQPPRKFQPGIPKLPPEVIRPQQPRLTHSTRDTEHERAAVAKMAARARNTITAASSQLDSKEDKGGDLLRSRLVWSQDIQGYKLGL